MDKGFGSWEGRPPGLSLPHEVGLLGGTFDPPHLGHLHLARAAQRALGLEALLFVPCSRQPLKAAPQAASPFDRCAMLALATAGHPTWKIATLELEAGGLSYTSRSLGRLDAAFPGRRWTLLLGADSLESLPRWRDWRDILRLARIAVAAREGGVPSALPKALERGSVTILRARPLEANSTRIRSVLKEGGDASAWLPRRVLQYIQTQGLYR